MTKIKNIFASEILDSRGNPTVETTVVLSDDSVGQSSVPAGASKGTYEAYELRDNDPAKYGGLGVLNAINNVNNVIAQKLIGVEAVEQQKIDKIMIEMDGTQTKSKLGANAILSVSQAVAKAAAKSSLLPLSLYLRQFLTNKEAAKSIPTPLFNMIEGGLHAPNGIDIQEFLVVPATSKSLDESLNIGSTVYHALKKYLSERSLSILVGDEGGFAPDISTNHDALTILKTTIENCGYKFAFDVFLGIDAAANSFKTNEGYKLKDKTTSYTTDELVEFYKTIFLEFSLMYIEDPFAEDDWEGWSKVYSALSEKTLIVGDDLTTTNPYRLQLAMENNAINSVVIKPTQIGTITEAMAVVEIARYKNMKIIASHRGGETMDDFIADFAVAIGADYVKFGAPVRERIVKYNRLVKIAQELKKI